MGRKVNAKTKDEPTNAYFDAKVLSRTHAQFLVSDKRLWIQDLKSSNGTFVNGKRLSEEGETSSPHILNDGDTIDFGVDIMDEAGKLLFRKVSSSVAIETDVKMPEIVRDDSALEMPVSSDRGLLSFLNVLAIDIDRSEQYIKS